MIDIIFGVFIVYGILYMYQVNTTISTLTSMAAAVFLWHGLWSFADYIEKRLGVQDRELHSAGIMLTAGAVLAYIQGDNLQTAWENASSHF